MFFLLFHLPQVFWCYRNGSFEALMIKQNIWLNEHSHLGCFSGLYKFGMLSSPYSAIFPV